MAYTQSGTKLTKMMKEVLSWNPDGALFVEPVNETSQPINEDNQGLTVYPTYYFPLCFGDAVASDKWEFSQKLLSESRIRKVQGSQYQMV